MLEQLKKYESLHKNTSKIEGNAPLIIEAEIEPVKDTDIRFFFK